MDEKKVEGQAQPQVSNAGNPAPSGSNAKVISRFGSSNTQPSIQVAAFRAQQPQANTVSKPAIAPTTPVANSSVTPNQQPAQTTTPAYHSAHASKATQKIDPFAEQNAKHAEKNKQRAKNRKILILASTVISILVIVAIASFIIIKFNRPNDKPWINDIPNISNSDDSVNEVQRYLQSVYDNDASGNSKKSKLENTNQAAVAVLDHGSNSDYNNQIILAQIQFYLANGYYNEIIKSVDKINIDALTLQQKLSFYNCLALAYQTQGDQSKYEEYYNLMLEISIELNGTGEYTDE